MRITRVTLKDVRRHAELELEFAPGLTIVRGPNEAGKTTIQRAIEIGLFRRATSEAAELDGVRRWGTEADPTVLIDFEDEGIRGRLVKVFAGSRGSVELTTDQGVERDPAAVEHVVTSLTGLPTEKFFLATASVHHHDLADLKQDENTLRDRLQQSMTGATRGTHAAKRKLEDALRRYRTEGAKNPGYLKVAKAEVERLQAEVASGEESLRGLERQRRALAEARDRRAALDAELARYQVALKTAERAVALQTRGADAQRRYDRYRRAAELRAEIARLETEHPSAIALPTLRATVERIRSLEFRLSEIRAELASEPDVTFEPVPEPEWRRWLLVGGVLVMLAGLALAVGVATGVELVGLAFAAGLVLAAVASGVRARRLRARVADVQLQNELRESEISRRLRGRSQRADDLRESERQRDEALATLAMDDLPAAELLLQAEADHVGQIDQLHAQYLGTLGDEEPERDVAQLRDEAAAEADECRHALGGMGEIGAQPDKSLANYRDTVERLRSDRERALAAELQAEAQLEANKVDAEQVAASSEELGQALERLAQVERRLRVYEHTLATLLAAEASTMKKAARFLEQSMGRDIAQLTDGRYRRLRVDETNLKFSVYSPERDDWTDADELSRGTLDQLYLCARLGIVRQVTQPASPPLIFDDPFVTFDDVRALRAVELLRAASGELQVIYLTTSDRYDDLADKVIELPGPISADPHTDTIAPAPATRAAERVGAPAA